MEPGDVYGLWAACAAVCPTKALRLSAKEMTPQEIVAEAEKVVHFMAEGEGLPCPEAEPLLHGEQALGVAAGSEAVGSSYGSRNLRGV